MSAENPTKFSVQPRIQTRTITTLGLLCAIAYAVMLMCKLLPNVYGFLSFDLKDIVICISGFIFGPLAAAGMATVVGLVEMLTVSETGPVGLIMNVLSSVAFCSVASFIYQRLHTKAGAVAGLLTGLVSATAVMLLWNYLITPMYQGVPREVIAAMLPTVFLPFNLAKWGLNTMGTLLLYKPVVGALRKANLVPEQQVNKKLGIVLFVGIVAVTLALMALAWKGYL